MVLEKMAQKSNSYIPVTTLPTTDWNDLVVFEPQLKWLLLEVQDVYDPGGKSFCSEHLWHSRYKSRVGGLVGFNAKSSNPAMRSREAYELACDVIREALPPCRNCGCLS